MNLLHKVFVAIICLSLFQSVSLASEFNINKIKRLAASDNVEALKMLGEYFYLVENNVGESISNYMRAFKLGDSDSRKILKRILDDVYRQELDLQVTHYAKWGRMGYDYQAIGDYEMAIKCYENSLGLRPDVPDVYIGLAASHLQLDNPCSAQEVLQFGCQISRDLCDVLLQMLNRGLARQCQSNQAMKYQNRHNKQRNIFEHYGQ